MDNATADFLGKAEAEYQRKVTGYIEEGLAEQQAGNTGAVDWAKIQTDYTNKKLTPSKVNEIYNYDKQIRAQKQQATKPTKVDAKPTAEEPSTLMDMGRQAVAGVAKFALNEAKFLEEVATWQRDSKFAKYMPSTMLANAMLNTQTLSDKLDKKPIANAVEGIKENYIPKAQTTAGEITSTISEFVTGFAGFSKWVNTGKKIAQVGKGAMVSAGIAGSAQVDESLINGYIDKLDPESKQAFLEMAGSTDGKTIPQSTRRVIATLEGAGLSAIADGFIISAKSVWKLWKGKGKNPVEEASKLATQSASKEATPEAVEEIVKPKSSLVGGMTAKELQAFVAEKEASRLQLATTAETTGKKHPYIAMEEANKKLEEAVGKIVDNSAETLEARASVIALKPAFARTAEDLVTASEFARFRTNPANTAPLKEMEQAYEPINKAVLKVESGKVLQASERTALIDEVAQKIDDLRTTGIKVSASGNRDLINQGILSPDGTLNLMKYAESKGADTNIGQLLAQVTVGTTKQQVAGSLAGALVAPSIVLADEGTPEAEKQALADRLLVGALFVLGGRFAFKYAFKGTKMADDVVLKEAEDEVAKKAIVEAETTVARSLPKAIAPISSTTAKVLPKIPQAKVQELTEALARGDVEVADRAKAEIFNLDNIDTVEDVDQLIKNVAEAFSDQTNRATRGVVTQAETKELAERLGTSEAELTNLYQDTSLLAERVVASRNLLPAIAEKAYKQAKALRELGTADEMARNKAILELRKTVAQQASIQMRLKGAQTEIARALSAMRIRANTNDLVIREMDDLVESLGGQEVNDLFAKQIVDIYENGGESAVNRWIRGSALSNSKDMLKAYWYSSVLSGLSTHMANIVGNLGIVVEGAWERTMANIIGRARGTQSAEYARASDYAKGLLLGAKLSVGMVSREFSQLEAGGAMKAFKTNAPVLDRFGAVKEGLGGGDLASLERPYAISSEAMGIHSESTMGKALDLAGKYVFSVPSRALVAEDEIFKSVNYYGELYHLVASQGRELGLAGKELEEHIAKFIQEPEVGMMEQALLKAREATFTAELDGLQKRISDVFSNSSFGFLIMPFVRTPMNILNHFGERLPILGGMMSKNREMWKAGGAQRDLVLAKQATGMLYTMSAITLASQGMITGGSLNDPNKQSQNVGNVQPYSIKVGDTYYSFNRLDPIGMFFGIVADWHEVMASQASEADKQNFATSSLTIISNFMQSKTYLRSLADIMRIMGEAQRSEAGGDPSQATLRYFGNLGGSLIPSLLSSANKSYVDPAVKEYWELTDYMKARLPIVSGEVPNKVNIFGEDQILEGGLGIDMASPVYVKTANPAPSAVEITRLNVDLKPPLKEIGNVKLTANQYRDYMKMFGTVTLGGKTFKETLEERIAQPDWESMSEDRGEYEGAKEKFIKTTYARFRKEVKNRFLRENPEVAKMVRDDKENKRLNLMGDELNDIPEQDPYQDADNFIDEVL